MTELPDMTLHGAAWEGKHLVFDDPEPAEKVRRKLLSASVASKTLQCPASMAAARLLPRTEDPFGAAELGTAGHSVLEELYNLPPEERTQERALALIEEAASKQWSLDKLKSKSRAAIKANNDNRIAWIEIITDIVIGDFDIENPQLVQVHRTEWQLFGQRIAHGPNADDGVPLVGYIDRTDVNEDGRLELKDYKTPPKLKRPNPRFGDDYGDQMRIYSKGVEAETGEMPASATLLYPRARAKREIDLSSDAIETTMAAFRGAWIIMNRSADARRFEAKPGNLCGWCPLANSCPVAKITTDKAREAASKQPSAVQLGIPTIRPGARAVAVSAPALPGRLPDEQVAAMSDGAYAERVESTVAAVRAGMQTVENPAAPRMWEGNEPQQRQDRSEVVTEGNIQFRTEGPAYEEAVQGALNLNSFAAIAACGFVSEAYAALDKAEVAVSAENLARMSDVLAGIVLRAQLATTGQANFQRGAQTRLRGLLRTFMEHRTPPFGGTADEWESWIGRAERFLVVALNQAIDLYERNPIDNDAHLHFAVQVAE